MLATCDGGEVMDRGGLLGCVHHYDRAGGVIDALLTYRAQKEAGEAAVTARANYEQIDRSGGSDEDSRRGALDNLTFDLDTLAVLSDVGERALEHVFGRSVKIAHVESER